MKTNRILLYLVVGLLGFAGSGQAVSMKNSPPEVYINTPLIFTLTQGDSTYAIPVLEKAQDVVAFYNYYSASSHTGYEVAYESKVFLYRNTIDNSLHLVITHNIDSPPPTGSGRVDFDLSGIPTRAYVSQSDDPSHAWDPPRTQEFSLAYPAMEGHWYYIDNTDGGVLSGLPLDTAWCITIEPLYFDNINRWIYHFGNGDPIELDMNKDVTLCFTPPEDPGTVNIDEGGQVSFSGFFDDPDASDMHTAVWEFGDSNDSAGTFSPGVGYTHHDMDPIVYTYGDNGTFDASLTVTDNHGGAGSADVSVIAANVPPTVEAGGDSTIVQGDTLIISASFSDPGWLDTHRATINWGDSNTDWGTVVEENDPPDATGTVTGSHVYEDCDIFTVVVTVMDDDRGTGSDSLYVTVVDATPPEITCPSDTVIEADENCEVTYGGPTATATDNCDPNPTITSVPPLPATFTGVGDHEIEYTATDGSGNASTCIQTIMVIDVTPPEIICPADTVIEADENCEVTYGGPSATATDNCDPDPTITSVPPLAATFTGVGDHEIEYTATDASGNASSCIQTIMVIDVTPPEIICPADTVIEADENCEVTYGGPGATATDNCDSDPTITSVPPLPGTFTGVGDHEIEYTATDAGGNASSCIQTITVIDVTPPQISCPPDTAMEPEGFNCEVTYSGPPALGTDNCDSDPTITSEPPLPATFGSIGDHVIVFTATDFSGNASVCTMTVTVLATSSCLKTEAIPFLEALKPTGDNHLDKEIDKVIRHIEKSLEPDLWIDVKHLGCKHGHKVFNEEKTAIVKLVKEMNKHKFPPELVDDFEIVINMLLDADEILARTQLDDAIDYGGEEKHIEKAESEMVKAQGKRDEGDHIHAIDHYRKAWDFACKAMGNPPGGGVQVALMRGVPSRFALSQNNPNPFSQTTSIRYQVSVPALVVLKVYDLSGRAIRTLVDRKQESGCYTAEWNGRDEEGKNVAAGIYFARFVAHGFTSTHKMVLLR